MLSDTLYASLHLLAQEDAQGPGFDFFLPLILIIGVIFYLMIIRPQANEQRQVKDMLKNLKKNDQVLTAGGIRGTVVNVAKDSPYVTIRVDEATNTKLKMLRSAISRVVGDKDDDEGTDLNKDKM